MSSENIGVVFLPLKEIVSLYLSWVQVSRVRGLGHLLPYSFRPLFCWTFGEFGCLSLTRGRVYYIKLLKHNWLTMCRDCLKEKIIYFLSVDVIFLDLNPWVGIFWDPHLKLWIGPISRDATSFPIRVLLGVFVQWEKSMVDCLDFLSSFFRLFGTMHFLHGKGNNERIPFS